MIIYKITHKLSGKIYIGQTVQPLKHRWYSHNSQKACAYLHRALKKYGKDAFTIEEIGSYKTIEDLNDAEEYYIDWFNCLSPNGYNLMTGGNNKLMHEDTRKKMSESHKGIVTWNKGKSSWNKGLKASVESRLKMSMYRKGNISPNKGKKMSEEQKEKISKTLKGIKLSEETKAKMSSSRKGVPWSEKRRLAYIKKIEDNAKI